MKRFVRLLVPILLMTILITSLTGCTPQLSSSCVPSGAGSVSPANGTYENGVLVDVTATPNSGYRFDHWEGGASGKSPTLHLSMNNSKKLVAYFTKTYTLSVSCSPTVGGSVSPNNGVYDEKSQVTLVASPNQYYQFNGWAGDVSGSLDHLTLAMDSDKKINAIFVKSNITIQTQILPQGAGAINPSSGSFVAGTQQQFTATPASGYRFDHWEGGASGTSNPSSIVLNNNQTITAHFVKLYNLSLSSNPTVYTISPNSGTFDSGTDVTLTASLLFPYAFKSWTGAKNNDVNPTTVIMNGDTTVSLNVVQCVKDNTQQTASGPLAQNMGFVPTTSVLIQLNKGEWVQGQIIADTNPLVYAIIKDPNGNIVKDLKAPGQANFTFSAQITGPYTITFQNNTIWVGHYNLSYNIYHLP